MEKEKAPDFFGYQFFSTAFTTYSQNRKTSSKTNCAKKQIVHETSSHLQRLEKKCKEVKIIEERQQFSNMLENYIADKMIKDVSLT
ncbi:hypothetical protein [Bartonella melophagi]|uniref:Uncharacterized protein n=1 Tax=Bartonella melophagi K-2C TaxID=1094557 RepID=J0QRX4_9HYPH|nr:hypothetical protein [Bartonella melophagi]EJF88591.1 hypothetical protein ME3_01049 [Bartonella melophagi K-2C]